MLNLSKRTTNILSKAGLVSEKDIINAGLKDLSKLHGIGPKSLKEISDFIKTSEYHKVVSISNELSQKEKECQVTKQQLLNISKETFKKTVEAGIDENRNFMLDRLLESYKLDEKDLMFYNPKAQMQTFFTLKFSHVNFKVNKDGHFYLNLEDGESISVQESNLPLKLQQEWFLSDVFTIFLKYDPEKETEYLKIYKAVKEGIWINGVQYKVLLQTPSQERTGNVYICPANKVSLYRKTLADGVDFEGSVNVLSKREKRIALSVSGGYILADRNKLGRVTQIYNFKVKYTEDIEMPISTPMIQPIEHLVTDSKELNKQEVAKLKSENKTLDGKWVIRGAEVVNESRNVEVTDGMGLVDIRTAAFWTYNMGRISRKQYLYFTNHFNGFNKEEIEADKKLNKILKKIPTAFQVRHLFDKGLLIIFDLKARGIEESVLMPKSMHKLDDKATESSAWRICNYNKDKRSYNYLGYQVLQNIDIPANLLCELGDETIEFIKRALSSADGALEYLNIHDNYEVLDESLASKLAQVLATNPDAIKLQWVQDGMKKLIEKQIHLTLLGKVIVPGDYYYMAIDPRVFFDVEETLKPGQYYFNGQERKLGLIRYPNVNSFEPQVVDAYNDKELWYLRDLMIFNPHDGVWEGMGGAD